MFFKKNDVLVVKGSVDANRAYDGVFISAEQLDTLKNTTIIVDGVSNLTRNDRDTQYVTIAQFKDYKLPSSIFNKIGEQYDEPLVNDTHYFRSKKTYDCYVDYLLD